MSETEKDTTGPTMETVQKLDAELKSLDEKIKVLEELHRSYPTLNNTHTKGYIKIEAQSADDHRDITNYFSEKKLEYYVIDPHSTRPLKLVITGLPDNIDSEDIKKSKGQIASSTECPLFLKPKKGKGKSPTKNLKRNFASNPVIPGISYSQALNPNKSHQIAAPGNTSSSSNNLKNNKNETINMEALNATQTESKQPNLNSPPPPQLNTIWSVFTKTLANTENCYLPQASSTPETESQVRELTREILNAHTTASKLMIHLERPFVQVGLYRQQAWEEHLTSLDAEDGSLWGTARAFRTKASPTLALNGPNGIALSDTNKTDLIAQSLESQFQLNDIHNPHKDEIITNIVDAYITNYNNNTDPIAPRSSIGNN
ncbi:uncharacterized protein TNCV_1579971 [Trichonephila clavipes]|nr:uncharacterized protein TNCV_1579971 [Trichonephila clavipes]